MDYPFGRLVDDAGFDSGVSGDSRGGVVGLGLNRGGRGGLLGVLAAMEGVEVPQQEERSDQGGDR
jgi:hypothetical protein